MNSSTIVLQISNFTEFVLDKKTNNSVTFIIISLLQIITGSLFNGFVASLLLINHRLLEVPANVILLSLGISDLFACAVVLPYNLYATLRPKESHIQHTLLLFSLTVSMIGTIILSADRFVAVVYPLRHKVLVTQRRTRYVLGSKWLFSLVYSAIFYIALRYRVKGVRYLLLFVKFSGVLAILVLYGVIFHAAFRQIKRIRNQVGDFRKASAVIFKRTKTSASIMFFVVISYLPVFILAACNEARAVPISTNNGFVAWLLCLAFLNCSVNPLLYCIFSKKLRGIILGYWTRMLSLCCGRTHSVPPAQSDILPDAG